MVHITNPTSFDFAEVWYVADPDTSLTNFDGWVNSAHPVPCSESGCRAFRIDSEISDSLGVNHPLIIESATANDVFEAGETWSFIINDYSNAFGLPPSAFDSIGVGDASLGSPSSGSIIAIVPEPTAVLRLATGLAALAWRLRRR